MVIVYHITFAKLYNYCFFYIKRSLYSHHFYTPILVTIEMIDANTVQ